MTDLAFCTECSFRFEEHHGVYVCWECRRVYTKAEYDVLAEEWRLFDAETTRQAQERINSTPACMEEALAMTGRAA